MKKFLMLLTLAGLMVPATFAADTKTSKDQPPAGQEQPKKTRKKKVTKKKKHEKGVNNQTAPTK